MSFASRAPFACLLVVLSADGLSACDGPISESPERASRNERSAILGGTAASAYPEAALLDLYTADDQLLWHCSASLIAPSVALTAGHCTTGAPGQVPVRWELTMPYLDNQHSSSTHAEAFDWLPTYLIDATKHDVGLVFLDTPIQIDAADCPALAYGPLADGDPMVNVGRVFDGTASLSGLFVSEAMPARSGDALHYPYAYINAKNYLEIGDSGGPDEAAGASPHLIVSVNSARIGTMDEEVLGRVDLLNNASQTWVQDRIQAHGGPCRVANLGTGNDGGSGSDGGTAADAGTVPDAGGGPRSGDAGIESAPPAFPPAVAGGCQLSPGSENFGVGLLLLSLLGLKGIGRRRRD